MKNTVSGKINFFINSYMRLFAAIFRIPLWFPFLILAIFQAAGLLAFANFHANGIGGILYPILSKFYSPAIFHYPQYFLAIPHIFTAYDRFLLGPTIGILMTAAAVYKLGGYSQGSKSTFSGGLNRALKSFFPLLLIWIINTAIILIVLKISAIALSGNLSASPRARLLAGYGFYLVSFVFSAFLLYVIPGIIITGDGLGAAMKKSLSLCGRNFFLTFFIIAVPGSIASIIDLFIVGFSPQVINLFNPELIEIMLFVRIGVGIFVNLFIYGAAVFLFNEPERQ